MKTLIRHRYFSTGLIALVLLLQVGLLVGSILPYRQALKEGEQLEIPIRLWDPLDVLRGRYVTLVPDLTIRIDEEEDLYEGETAWIALHLNEDGELHAQASYERPEGTAFRALVRGTTYRDGDRHVNIDWPIRRYFMNEALAPEAERILRDSTRAPWDNSPSEETHAVIVVVRVLNGVIVAEEVLVDGVPLEQLSEEALEAASPQP